MGLKFKGFTLAELLITLAILGVIATFTIPKVLTSNQNSSRLAITKEAIATVSAAYQNYRQDNTPTAASKPSDLFQYLNYVKYDTTSTIDQDGAGGSQLCTVSKPCLKLHNGAMILADSVGFAGTATGNAIFFDLDPSGVYDGDISLIVVLYFNGRITSAGGMDAGTLRNNSPFGPISDPTWYKWN